MPLLAVTTGGRCPPVSATFTPLKPAPGAVVILPKIEGRVETWVACVAALFARFKSGVSLAALTALVISPADDGITTIVIPACVLGARLPIPQLTALDPEQPP